MRLIVPLYYHLPSVPHENLERVLDLLERRRIDFGFVVFENLSIDFCEFVRGEFGLAGIIDDKLYDLEKILRGDVDVGMPVRNQDDAVDVRDVDVLDLLVDRPEMRGFAAVVRDGVSLNDRRLLVADEHEE